MPINCMIYSLLAKNQNMAKKAFGTCMASDTSMIYEASLTEISEIKKNSERKNKGNDQSLRTNQSLHQLEYGIF